MATITAVSLSIAMPPTRDGTPVICIVTSSAAVYSYNAASSVWKPLSMNTT